MKGKRDSNMMRWDKSDPRWGTTWWGNHKTFHRLHDKWHEKFVRINAWSWARSERLPLRVVVAAMREAWEKAPCRYDIHGVQMYRTEMKKHLAAYRRAIKTYKKNTKGTQP